MRINIGTKRHNINIKQFLNKNEETTISKNVSILLELSAYSQIDANQHRLNKSGDYYIELNLIF